MIAPCMDDLAPSKSCMHVHVLNSRYSHNKVFLWLQQGPKHLGRDGVQIYVMHTNGIEHFTMDLHPI
jgi:hypothetical protein